MLNKDSFKIDAFFKMYKNHRIILIGGHAASGKTILINEIKKFYEALNIHNLDYSFDPYCRTEQSKLSKFKNESVVLYADDLFFNNDWSDRFSKRVDKHKATTLNILQTSYQSQVHKIFITTQLHRSIPTLNQYVAEKEIDYFASSKELMHFADLVLKINNVKELSKVILSVTKDRMSSYQQSQKETNFFKMMAYSYKMKNDRFDYTWEFRKYMQGDYSMIEVESFKELFGYK